MSSARPTTFSLSQIYRSLGLRDPRIIPNVAAGQLVPVISLGSFETFAPEVIEARGFVNAGPFNLLGGQWLGLSHQSTAAGGTIIETFASAQQTVLNLAPTKPFTAGSLTPFSTGGQALGSLFEVTGVEVGAAPLGAALGGSQSGSSVLVQSNAGNIWVPPAWWFWAIMFGPQNAAFAEWRFREIPESQGPA